MRNLSPSALAVLLFVTLMQASDAQTSGIHDNGTIAVEVFDNGFIGTDPLFAGTGFVFNGDNGLFVATVLVGIAGDADTVPYNGSSEFTSLSPVMALSPPFDEPFEEFDQGFETAFSSPLGFSITQRSYTASIPPDHTYMILDLSIENTSGAPMQNAFAGIFADWDVGDFIQNVSGYDSGSNLLYTWDDTGTSPHYFGVAALWTGASGWSSDISFTDEAIFADMTNGGEIPDTFPHDRRSVLGVGPYDLSIGETATVRFAFVGGTSELDVIANAHIAQAAIHPSDSMAIDNGVISTAIYNNGNIGGDCSGNHPGFSYRGSDPANLCAISLLVGLTSTNVLGDDYTSTYGNTGWGPATLEASTIFPYSVLDQGVKATFSDNVGVGLDVVLNAYYSLTPPNDAFLVLKYDITNSSGTTLTTLVPGLFVDWNVNAPQYTHNDASFDSVDDLMMVYDGTAGIFDVYGIAILNRNLLGWECMHPYFSTDADVFAAMTSSGPAACFDVDVRSPIGVSPITLADGETESVLFALIPGTDTSDWIANWAAALKATSIVVGIGAETTELTGTHRLYPIFPNPFNPEASVRFAVKDAAPVTLTLYDVLGRQVSTLYDGVPEANTTLSVQIDGRGLPSGLYLVQLSGQGFTASQPITLLK